MLAASIHPLGVPKTDDLDIFFGIGLSRVESTLKSGIRMNPTIAEYATTTQTQLNSSYGALYFRRIGIASGGKNFGIMLEFLLLGNEEFIENPFAKSTIIDSAIYDSTYNDRGGALPSKVGTLFREKNQVKQVSNGQECRITVKDYMDFQKNDTIEAFSVTSTERSI